MESAHSLLDALPDCTPTTSTPGLRHFIANPAPVAIAPASKGKSTASNERKIQKSSSPIVSRFLLCWSSAAK
jgi:hypothetical protein